MKYILQKLILFLFVLSFSNLNAQNNFREVIYQNIKSTNIQTEKYNNFSIIESDNISTRQHSVLNLTWQLLVGSALTIIFTTPSLIIGYGTQDTDVIGQTALTTFAISSYIFGSGVGVHWIAHYENPDNKFWESVGYAAIGGGASILVFALLSTQYTTIPAVGGTIAAALPVLGSMFYASFVADWPQENQKVTFYNNDFSHKDLVDQSKLFDIELLRINF